MLDGHVVEQEQPEEKIHQTGMTTLKVHRPYPRRKGEKVTTHLITYTEHYSLTITPDGLVYRCDAPFGGVELGGVKLKPVSGGGYDIWLDRNGRLQPGGSVGAESEGVHADEA